MQLSASLPSQAGSAWPAWRSTNRRWVAPRGAVQPRHGARPSRGRKLSTAAASGDAKEAATKPQLGEKSLLSDIVAGCSVAFVCIPQALGCGSHHKHVPHIIVPMRCLWLRPGLCGGVLSGVPVPITRLSGLVPTQGLYSNAVAPIPSALTQSSRYLQTGCMAVCALITGGALAAHGIPAGSPMFAALASMLAIMAGICRIVLGFCRGGSLLTLMPPTVLDGFTLGAVWLVFTTQFPHVMGVAPPPGMHYVQSALWILLHPLKWNLGSLWVALMTIVLLQGGKKISPLFPGALVALAIGCTASYLGLPVGNTVGAVKAGLPSLLDPRLLPWGEAPKLIVPSVAIAIAAFAESAGVAKRFADEAGDKWDPNRELVSSGIANVFVGLFGGFAVAGSVSRTSLARLAGAKTKLAHAITGLVVLAALPFAGAVMVYLPKAVLGGLLCCAAYPLLKPADALHISSKSLKTWRGMRAVLLGWFTCAITIGSSPKLEVGLEAGVVLAVTLAALQIIDRSLLEGIEAAARDGDPNHPDVTPYSPDAAWS